MMYTFYSGMHEYNMTARKTLEGTGKAIHQIDEHIGSESLDWSLQLQFKYQLHESLTLHG